MKKILTIILLNIILLINICSVQAQASTETMNQLRLQVKDADESYSIYMLLPRDYIEYAIKHDGLDMEYQGSNTIKFYTIPSITVDVDSVLDETYVDNHIEYVQIKLDDIGEQEYFFELLPDYPEMDMMYRVESDSKDDLLLLSNFKFRDGTCKITYNYKENTIKTEDKKDIKLKFDLKWWQILIIFVLIIFVIVISKRRNY